MKLFIIEFCDHAHVRRVVALLVVPSPLHHPRQHRVPTDERQAQAPAHVLTRMVAVQTRMAVQTRAANPRDRARMPTAAVLRILLVNVPLPRKRSHASVVVHRTSIVTTATSL